jgi:H+/gluconate symporter-like permease
VNAFVVTMAAFVLGWMLFGAAAWRARVYPRPAALLLVGGSPLAIGTLLVVGFPTGVFFSAAVAWLGYTLWSEKDAPVGQPVRVS